MSIRLSISTKLITTFTILLTTPTSNGSPAPPFPPIMTSHTEMIDLGHLKMLPAGTYPDYAAAGMIAATEDEPDGLNHGLVKRSWQNLHGAWGKRTNNNNNRDGIEYNSNMESFNANNNLLSVSKEDDFIDENDSDYQDFLKYSEIYRMTPGYNVIEQDSSLSPLLTGITEAKRAWKNLNTAWGKRRGTNDWNKFRGSWGKRQPSWNNLKGLWGKRSTDWNKLQAAWGKRSTVSTGLNGNSGN